MLEVVLAVSVLAAVVVVGVLISIGNERQRKAIEQLRDDVRNWALGDLEIKRETASRDIKISSEKDQDRPTPIRISNGDPRADENGDLRTVSPECRHILRS